MPTDRRDDATENRWVPEDLPEGAIAVVGVGCRFADVEGPDELWAAVTERRELVTRLDGTEREGWVLAGGVLRDSEEFDAPLFGVSPGEAALMDPQQRVFLECCWHALEHAGYDPRRFPGDIGVFAGSSDSGYLSAREREVLGQSANPMTVEFGNGRDFLATRVSYGLGLTGPGVVVQTACSTSLTAVHLAGQSLADYECDVAIAGGSSIAAGRSAGYPYVPDGILSPDGHCRPFDARAAGTVPSDGVAAVVLRRADEAFADGDHVIALLLSSAVRNDGARKVGFGAPSVDGQITAMRAAYAAADVDPATVGLVEAHGTGTELGDPIEFAALSEVLGRAAGRRDNCRISAVKGVLGHTDAVSGVAGLLVAAMAVRDARVPPIGHFERANPRLDLDGSGLSLTGGPAEWPATGGPRRAAVNSLGIGGTNVHVVLQEAPVPAPARPPDEPFLLPVSAASPEARDRSVARLGEYLDVRADLSIADVARTLQHGRTELPYRAAAVASDRREAVKALSDPVRAITDGWRDTSRPVRVGFLFPGGGAQRSGMGEDLYRRLPAFRRVLHDVVSALPPEYLGPELGTWLDDGLAGGSARRWIEDPESALPALFLVEYTLGQLLIGIGLSPDGMLGHSLGEYTAATLAGVFSLPDAWAVVRERGRILGSLPAGGMLSVALGEDELRSLADARGLDIAAVNGTEQCVVTGPLGELHDLQQHLAARDVDGRLLPLSTAAHSRAIDAHLGRFDSFLRDVPLGEPRLDFVSNLTGGWAEPDVVRTPGYWTEHLRRTVRYREGMTTLAAGDEQTLLLEVGPGAILGALARRELPGHTVEAVPVCGRHGGSRPESTMFLTAVASAWANGHDLDWDVLGDLSGARRVPLPGYPFERRRHAAPRGAASPPTASVPMEPAGPVEPAGPAAVRIGVPGWRQVAAADMAAEPVPAARWQILPDNHGLAERLVVALRDSGRLASLVPAADPAGDPLRQEVVDLTGISAGAADDDPGGRYRAVLDHAAVLGRTMAAHVAGPARLTAVVSGAMGVTGADDVDPALAPLASLCAVLPAESDVRARVLDIGAVRDGGDGALNDLVARLLPVLLASEGRPVVALRGRQWWAPATEDVPVAGDTRAPDVLPARPVVLVTGGFGGVGLRIAEHLGRSRSARLVLVSRRGADDEDRRTALGELMADGIDVLSLTVDLTRPGAADEIVGRAVGHFGRLDVAVHAAAVPFGAALEVRDGRAAAANHAIKVDALLALERAIRRTAGAGRQTLLIGMTSASVTEGTVGAFDYLASNLFLDARALRWPELADGPRIASVGWGRWRGVGMARALENRHHELTGSRLLSGMDPTRAAEAFDECLRRIASGDRRLVVSATSADAAGAGPPGDAGVVPPEDAPARPAPSARPARLGPAEPPGTELEELVVGLWSDALGIDPVGATDNFFDLGGDSLISMQIVKRLRETLGAGVSVQHIFEHPVARDLAAALAATSDAGVTPTPRRARVTEGGLR